MSEASSELENLHERMRRVTAEVEAGEQRARTSPSRVELPDSAQLTLQFVDDLVSTNRERMRDQISQRYAWAGERLTGAHAEAQGIVSDALAELTAAMREHDAAREHHLDDLPLAALMASMAPSTPGSPTVETGSAVVAEDRAALPQDAGADTAPAPRPPAHDPKATVARLVAEVEAPATLDGVVDSAVQAILRALTEPGNEAPPVPTAAPATRSVTAANGVLEALADGAPATRASGSTTAPAHLAPSVGDDADLLPIDGEGVGVGDDVLAGGFGDFWGDKLQSTESRRARFRPRDVMIGTIVLVVLVLVALAFIG